MGDCWYSINNFARTCALEGNFLCAIPESLMTQGGLYSLYFNYVTLYFPLTQVKNFPGPLCALINYELFGCSSHEVARGQLIYSCLTQSSIL